MSSKFEPKKNYLKKNVVYVFLVTELTTYVKHISVQSLTKKV